MSDVNNGNADSVVLNLETLTNQYDTILLQYQQAIANYTSFLQQNNNSEQTFTTVKGNAFWGTGSAGSQSVYTNVNTPSACQALCSQTNGCSGATFNPQNNGLPACFLRSGNGITVPSSASDYAIIPTSQQYLINMQGLNQELTKINQKIMNIISNQGNQVYSSEQTQRAIKKTQLSQNYNKLMKEQKEIEEQLKEYKSLEEEQYNTELVTNSNYFSYILLLFLAIICIYIVIKISSNSNSQNYNTQYGGKLGNKPYYIIFIILFLILFVYYYKNLM
jgi:hypothetical protein